MIHFIAFNIVYDTTSWNIFPIDLELSNRKCDFIFGLTRVSITSHERLRTRTNFGFDSNVNHSIAKEIRYPIGYTYIHAHADF